MANVKWSSFTSGGDMQVGDQTVGLRSGNNYRFTFPSVGIKDSNGNYLLQWASAGATAVNYPLLTSSVSGGAIVYNAGGSDANISVIIASKGNGDVNLDPSGTGVINATTTLLLSTSSPTLNLEAASKGYVDSQIPSFPISLAHGGTSAALTANNGGIFYSTSTAGAILAGTATATQMLQSGSSSAPAWSTSTWPATTTVNQLLYSSSSNTVTGLATANNGAFVTSNTGVPSILAGPGSTGNMFKSNTSAAPSWSTAIYSDTYTINNLLYASSANTVSGLATAANGVLVTNGSGVPSIGSTLPSAVQLNITQLGTITSGTWNGTIISPQYGGTGINNASNTLTLGGVTTFSGAFPVTFTFTGSTNVTFPTSGTLATVGGTVSSITGTANQVLANGTSGSAQTGSVTLTTPQNINTTAAFQANTVQFNSTDGILGSFGNPVLKVFGNSGAVNYWNISNSTTGNPINFYAGGTDSNISVGFLTQGTGQFIFSSDASTPVNFKSGTSKQHTTQFSFANTAASQTVTFPDATFTVAGTTVALSGTGVASFTAYAPICGGTTSTGALQSATAGSAGQLFTSNGAGALPSWTTATFPTTAGSAGTILRSNGTNWVASTATFADTYTASNLLYSNGANTVTGLATANSAQLVTNSSGVPAMTSSMTNGQVVIGSTGATPTPATLTAGANISITNGAGSITIATTGVSAFAWTNTTSTSFTATVNTGFVLSGAGTTTVTLPTIFSVGDRISIAGNQGPWVLNVGASRFVVAFGTVYSTSFASANNTDTIELVGITANSTWGILGISSKGLTAS